MVSLTLLVITIGVGYFFYDYGIKSFNIGEKQSNIQQNVRFASDFITKEIRYASTIKILASVPTDFESGYNYIYVKNNTLVYNQDGTETNVLSGISNGISLNRLYFHKGIRENLLYFKIDCTDNTFSIESTVMAMNLTSIDASALTSGVDGWAIRFKTPQDSKEITFFSFASLVPEVIGTINDATRNISLTVPYGTNRTTLTATFVTTGKIVKVAGVEQTSTVTINNFTNPVTYSVTAYNDSTSTWTVTVSVANTAPMASNVIITGTTQVGQTLIGNYNYADAETDLQGLSIFKWYRGSSADGSGKVLISEANSTTYTLISADQGKYIFFEVTPVAATGTAPGSPVVSPSILIPANTAPYANNVGITRAGQTLNGNYTYDDADGDAQGGSTFRWYRGSNSNENNKAVIIGATAQTYNLVAASDEGKYLFFEVTPVAIIGASPGTTVVSASLFIPVNTKPEAQSVNITRNGQTLTGNYTYYDADGDAEWSSTFKWYKGTKANGKDKAAIAGANVKTYTPPSADAGKYFFFEVTPAAATGASPGNASLSGSIKY